MEIAEGHACQTQSRAEPDGGVGNKGGVQEEPESEPPPKPPLDVPPVDVPLSAGARTEASAIGRAASSVVPVPAMARAAGWQTGEDRIFDWQAPFVM